MARLTLYEPKGSARAILILAHGAGVGQHSPFMVKIARLLAARDFVVATFDFPYMAAGRKGPDKPAVLEQSWRDAIDAARQHDALAALPLFIGGKSMGGRIASQVAAQGVTSLAGLVFLGYPLHPPGRPQQRRDSHLPSIKEPMLFVQGERDDFGRANEIRELIPGLNPLASLHPVPAGDHSFKVPASSGTTADDVLRQVSEVVGGWMVSIIAAPSADRP